MFNPRLILTAIALLGVSGLFGASLWDTLVSCGSFGQVRCGQHIVFQTTGVILMTEITANKGKTSRYNAFSGK
jgi:hypothetical protein